MKPVNDNGIRLAPAENRINGIAVIAPENSSQNDDIFNLCYLPMAATTHSIVMLLIASICTIFFSKP